MQRVFPFTVEYSNAAFRENVFLTLNLNVDSTLLIEQIYSKAVCHISFFCVLDAVSPLFLKCLDLAENIRFLFLYFSYFFIAF